MPVHPAATRKGWSAEDLALEEALEGARRRIIARLLDGARAELPARDLTPLLDAVRGVAAGADPARAAGRLRPDAALTLRSVSRLLTPDAPPDPGDLVAVLREARLRAWLEAHLDGMGPR